MLSLVNAFGGLSSAELMILFGAKSPSSSLGSKSTNTDRPASPGVSGASTNNAANAIQAILAQAQIDKTDIEQALTPPSSPNATAASIAPSATTGASASAANDTAETTPAQVPTSVNSVAAQASPSNATSNPIGQPESPGAFGSRTNDPASTIQAVVAQTQIGRSFVEASGSAIRTEVTYTSDSSARDDFRPQSVMSFTAGMNAQGHQVDNFEFGITFQGRTVTVGFSIEGLGLSVDSPVQVAVDAMALGNPIGKVWDSLSIGIPGHSGGEASTAEFNIYGLDAAQAQQLSAAFEDATLAPAHMETSPSGAHIYYEKSGIGFFTELGVATGVGYIGSAHIPGV